MYPIGILSFCAILALATAQTVSSSSGPSHGKIVMCSLVTEYNLKLRKISFKNDQINPNLCTHLVTLDSLNDQNGMLTLDIMIETLGQVKRNQLSANLSILTDPWESRNDVLNSNYSQITNLKATFPHLKVLLGTDYTLSELLNIASTTPRLVSYLTQAESFLWMYNFDGLNIQIVDWEQSKITKQEFEKVSKFIIAIKEVCKKFQLLLTLTVSISEKFNAEKYNLSELSKSFDFVNILQMKEPNNKMSINKFIEMRQVSSIEENILNITEYGVPAAKITIGFLLGGLSFAPPSGGVKPVYSHHSEYREICKHYSGLNAKKWEKSHDQTTGLGTLKNKLNSEVIIYENSRTVANLVRFAIKHGLAGVYTNPINMDDYLSECNIETDTFDDYIPADGITLHIPEKNLTDFPILRTINEAITVTMDEISQSGGASLIVINVFCMSLVAVSIFVSSSIV